MNNQITILIPTSPIPSHPSTAILDETISNLRKYTDAPIIIMEDGVHESLASRTEDYDAYKQAIFEKIESGEYGRCFEINFEHHTHQAEMTKQALKHHVKTPLIMFVEHDTSIIGDVPFKELCDLVELSNEINYIRFNIFHEVLDVHQYLMLDKVPRIYNGVRLVRTIQYSQRPHIAKSNWYRDILFTWFKPQQKTMIEDVMHSVVISKYECLGFDTFGLAIYAPEGNMLRSYHSDGRGDDEKIIEG